MRTQLANKKNKREYKTHIDRNIDNITIKIYSKGTIRIPAAIRSDLHLNDGDEVQFVKYGEQWALTTREKMFKDAQAYFKKHNPKNISLADELIAERRKLAAEE